VAMRYIQSYNVMERTLWTFVRSYRACTIWVYLYVLTVAYDIYAFDMLTFVYTGICAMPLSRASYISCMYYAA
jgi:hypothetical protein